MSTPFSNLLLYFSMFSWEFYFRIAIDAAAPAAAAAADDATRQQCVVMWLFGWFSVAINVGKIAKDTDIYLTFTLAIIKAE